MAELSEEVMQKIMGMEEENRVLEAGIEPLYTAIGRNYYEKPEGYEKEMEQAADQLDAIKKKMHENHIEVLALKGIRLCPNCGSEVEQGAIFCGECGIRIEAVKEVDENSVLCSRCGAKNEKGKKFCVICGQKLVDIIKAAQEESGQNMKWLDEEVSDEIEVLGETATAIEKNENEIVKDCNDNAATEVAGSGVAENIEVPENTEGAENTEVPENTEEAEKTNVAEDADMPQEGVIFCPNCGNELPADALYCGECGVRIVEEMPQETQQPVGDMPLFCTECGTKLEPGSAFCTECGTPVATEK